MGPEHLGEQPLTALLFARGGLSWLGWMLLRWRRRAVPDVVVLGRYLVLAGSARFLFEFIRVNVRVALGLTVAQWASLALVLAGAALIGASMAARQPVD